MTQTAYISGKITGAEKKNKPKFQAAEKLLRKLGYKTINPHSLCSDIHPDAHWTTFMKRCLSALPSADVVVVLDDWHLSKGAQIEVEMAGNLGMTVLEIETMQPLVINYRAFAVVKGTILNIR